MNWNVGPFLTKHIPDVCKLSERYLITNTQYILKDGPYGCILDALFHHLNHRYL